MRDNAKSPAAWGVRRRPSKMSCRKAYRSTPKAPGATFHLECWQRPSRYLVNRAEAIHKLGAPTLEYLLAELIDGQDPAARTEAYSERAPFADFIRFGVAPIGGRS
jgi:hypothetical protein